MNEHDAFLQSIVDDADDDAPRLVFADWLDDHGDSLWAQFIRAQCRLAKLGELEAERYRLEYEEASLLPEMTQRLSDRKHPHWFGRLGGWLKDQRPFYERGFVTRLGTTPTRFLDHADNLMKAAPIQHLTLNNVGPRLDDLLPSPHLLKIRSLVMTHQRIGDEAMRKIADCPGVANLKNLDLLRNRFRIEGAAALAGSPHLGKLERLALNLNRIHDRGPEALAASTTLKSLKRLELSDCQIGPRGATALAHSAGLEQLEWLDLSANRISDAGAEALAGTGGLKNLTHLNVARNVLSPDGLRTLLQDVGLKRLTSLHVNVYGNGEGFWRLTPAEHLRGRLELRADFWEDVRWTELEDSPLLSACAGLTLYGGRSGDRTAQALAETKASAGLVSLELVNADLRETGVLALVNSPNLPKLRRLSLAGNRLTNAAYAAAVNVPLTRQLTHLDLRSWTFSTDEVKAILGAQALDKIERLRLSASLLEDWKRELRQRFGWRVAFE